MQIGEQHLSAPQLLAFDGERLLHLHDQLGFAENPLRAIHQRRPGGAVIVVAETGADARPALQQHRVPVMHQFGDR